MNIRAPLLVVLALPLAAVACSGGDAAPSGGASPSAGTPKAVSPIGMKQAQELFQSLCSTCHGTSGKGDGAVQGLDPKPRSFADAVWQASVTDDHIRKVITFGGSAVGKSPAMPPQPQLKSQPEVLDGLVSIVRGFNSK